MEGLRNFSQVKTTRHLLAHLGSHPPACLTGGVQQIPEAQKEAPFKMRGRKLGWPDLDSLTLPSQTREVPLSQPKLAVSVKACGNRGPLGGGPAPKECAQGPTQTRFPDSVGSNDQVNSIAEILHREALVDSRKSMDREAAKLHGVSP
jgi:hypothetical protein